MLEINLLEINLGWPNRLLSAPTNKSCRYLMVPTARLELAQLSPLPPQDSVSTNFTTSAFYVVLISQRL